MSKASNARKTSRTAAVAAIVLASLALAGCGSTPSSTAAVASASPSATSGPGTAYPGGDGPLLPYADMFSVINAPLMDRSAHFTGETARLADPRYNMAVFYDKPDGKAIGSLPSELPVPIVGRTVAPAPSGSDAPNGPAPTGEWIRVMLPSRVALPSTAGSDLRPHVNEGTAWIWAKDMSVANTTTLITINKAAHTVSVGTADGSVIGIVPADIGVNVPNGPTFMTQHTGASTPCSGGPLLPLSAQGTNADGLDGQPVNPIAIMGPGDDCFAAGPSDLTPVLPNMVRVSARDAVQLAPYAVPGTPVVVLADGQGS